MRAGGDAIARRALAPSVASTVSRTRLAARGVSSSTVVSASSSSSSGSTAAGAGRRRADGCANSSSSSAADAGTRVAGGATRARSCPRSSPRVNGAADAASASSASSAGDFALLPPRGHSSSADAAPGCGVSSHSLSPVTRLK